MSSEPTILVVDDNRDNVEILRIFLESRGYRVASAEDGRTALAKVDDRERPPNWKLSPWAVATYLLGGKAGKMEITPKYIGARRLMEIAIATLATDRALLLLGVPGTAKTCVMPSASRARTKRSEAFMNRLVERDEGARSCSDFRKRSSSSCASWTRPFGWG